MTIELSPVLKPEIRKMKASKFVTLSSFKVPVSYSLKPSDSLPLALSSNKSGAFGAEGAVTSIVTASVELSYRFIASSIRSCIPKGVIIIS